MTHTRCLIIGSGPAGYTAGIYTGRADLKPLLYEGLQPGGQLTITTEIENFPGYPEGISGPDMMGDLRKQALRFGTEMRKGTIESIDLSHRPFIAVDDKGEQIEAETVIVATGASASTRISMLPLLVAETPLAKRHHISPHYAGEYTK